MNARNSHSFFSKCLAGRRGTAQPARSQRGVTMLFGLIALAIMMIGAAAMVRSMNTSLFSAGNLGFKRDLTNQAERALANIMPLMNAGVLSSELARQSHSPTQNYSAMLLPSNAQGVPNALVSDTLFGASARATNDIVVADQAVVVRYIVDRLCTADGLADASRCTMSDLGVPSGGSASALLTAVDNSTGGAGALPQQVVYRLSIRVTGPRNTQAFFQTTFSR